MATGLVLAAVLAIAWFVRAPYSTLDAIKTAAERRDLSELDRLIDFPSLRHSVKLLLMDSLQGEPDQPVTLGRGLARLFGGAMAGPLVETMVTPAALAAMFDGKLPERASGRYRSVTGPASEDDKKVSATSRWSGLSEVRVAVRARSEELAGKAGLTFVMRRDGLAWRLAAIER